MGFRYVIDYTYDITNGDIGQVLVIGGFSPRAVKFYCTYRCRYNIITRVEVNQFWSDSRGHSLNQLLEFEVESHEVAAIGTGKSGSWRMGRIVIRGYGPAPTERGGSHVAGAMGDIQTSGAPREDG